MARVYAATTALKAADHLIWLSQEHGDPITNLKLQKLLYYSQGWFLALYERPLFRDEIQAWIRGPAVYSVWKIFSDYKYKPITRRIRRPNLHDTVSFHLDEIMGAYGDFSAFTLERMTHEEAPWLNAREGLQAGERSSRPISMDDMRTHFSQLADET